MLAVFSNLVGCAIQASACVFLLAPLVLLAASGTCANCKVEQLLVLAFMSFRLVDPTYNVGLVFFGFYCLLIGYFILRSAFLLRTLGALIGLAGSGSLTFLAPPLAIDGRRVLPFRIVESFVNMVKKFEKGNTAQNRSADLARSTPKLRRCP